MDSMRDTGTFKKGTTKNAIPDTQMSDLDRGYSDASEIKGQDKKEFFVGRGGVVGRPEGWER